MPRSVVALAPSPAVGIKSQRAACRRGSRRPGRLQRVCAQGDQGGDDLAKQFAAFKRRMNAQVDRDPNVKTAAPPRCAPPLAPPPLVPAGHPTTGCLPAARLRAAPARAARPAATLSGPAPRPTRRRFSQQQRGGWNDAPAGDKLRRQEARLLDAWTSERGMQLAAAGTVLLVVAMLAAAGGPPADPRCTLPWC